MRNARAAAIVVAAAVACLSAAAVAATIDRVQVGVSGRNATRGLSPVLYVDVPVVADYKQSKFDGEQGDWQGPDYSATQSSTTGRTDLSFRSDFENTVGSLDGMAKHALVHKDWTQTTKQSVRLTRLLSGKTVGDTGGELALFREPIDTSARWEAVVALPLCHGVFAGIDFYADAPPADTSGTAGQYQVGTTPAKQWNQAHVLDAARGVELDGPLPGAHIAAHRTGKTIAGVVGDCGGGLQNVPVALQRKAGTGWTASGHGVSGAGGKFRLTAGPAGSYRVVAKLGPFAATTVLG